jgi:HEAT repeat protein
MSFFKRLFNRPPNIAKLEKKKDVDGLLSIVKDQEDTKIRQEAVKALTRLDNPSVIQLLMELLADEEEDIFIRSIIPSYLGNRKETRAVDLLVKIVDKYLKSVRRAPSDIMLTVPSITALGKIGGSRALETLINALTDRLVFIRRESAQALGSLGDKRAIPELRKALKDADKVVRIYALHSLIMLGEAHSLDSVIGVLEVVDKGRNLEAEEITVIEAAAKILGDLREPRAVVPLIRVLQKRELLTGMIGEYLGALYEVVRAIGNIGDPRAIPSLAEFLEHEQSMKKDWPNLASDEMIGVLKIAIEQLLKASQKPRTVKSTRKSKRAENAYGIYSSLIKSLSSSDGSKRQEAAEKLAGAGKDAVSPLIEALTDKHPGVRAGAAYALGKIGDLQAAPPLIDHLQDPNENVRSITASALGRLGDPRAGVPLSKILKDSYADARLMASRSLANIAKTLRTKGETGPVSPLIEALDDQDKRIRLNAVIALARIGDERAVQPLMNLMLRQEDYDVQTAAIAGLGDLGSPMAVPLLVKILEAVKDDFVKGAVIEALGKTGADYGSQVQEVLVPFLGDSDVFVRQMTCKALGMVGDKRIAPSLEYSLNDTDEKVSQAARKSLKKLKPIPLRSPIELEEIPDVQPDQKPKSIGKMEKMRGDITYTYHLYIAADANSARAFLNKEKIDHPFEYISVETPEGIWGLDQEEGLYLVDLMPWQRDLRLAECSGELVSRGEDITDNYHFRMAYESKSPETEHIPTDERFNNFVGEVKCGQCGNIWQDGLAHQKVREHPVTIGSTTVVRCPECKTYNLVEVEITLETA